MLVEINISAKTNVIIITIVVISIISNLKWRLSHICKLHPNTSYWNFKSFWLFSTILYSNTFIASSYDVRIFYFLLFFIRNVHFPVSKSAQSPNKWYINFIKSQLLNNSIEISFHDKTRYQRGNQNPYIDEEQTTQWPNKGTKGQTTIYKTYT
jgi:hypothetical protein